MSADINTVFCTAQNVFATDAAVDSADWIDFKVAMDLAAGKAPVVEVIVTTTFVGGTGAQFLLLAVDSAGANAVVIDETPAFLVADLVAPEAGNPGNLKGTVIHLRMSPKSKLPGATLTHLRLRVNNFGANTAGAITAQLVEEAGTSNPNKAYAAGY